jgi:hypothetical protein
MCSDSLRSTWLFLEEKATHHRAFGEQRLDNSYSDIACDMISACGSCSIRPFWWLLFAAAGARRERSSGWFWPGS